ncbi:MAG: hypothetical protein WAP74_04210 [Patescibacteria group bacterium]
MTPVQAKKLEEKINRLEKLLVLHIKQSEDDLTLTAVQKKALAQAEKNYREGKTLSIDELKQKLGFTD